MIRKHRIAVKIYKTKKIPLPDSNHLSKPGIFQQQNAIIHTWAFSNMAHLKIGRTYPEMHGLRLRNISDVI